MESTSGTSTKVCCESDPGLKIRNPKSEGNPKSEIRIIGGWIRSVAMLCPLFSGALLAFAGELTPTPNLPNRSTNALSGREFAARVSTLNLAEREEVVYHEITSGNVPDFLRQLC